MESRDEWGEPRDDESASEYPTAPIPPHERAWRHPSELAANTVRDLPPASPLGRGLVVVTGVAAVVLAVGLVRLLTPGGTSVASVGATSVPALQTTTSAPATTSPAGTLQAPSTTASAPLIPLGTDPLVPPSTLVTSEGSSAITWTDGAGEDNRWAVTSAEGLTAGTSTAVALPDGSSLAALVVVVDEGSGVALLVFTGPDAATNGGTPPAPSIRALPPAGSTVLAVARDGNAVEATLVVDGDLMVVEPMAPAEIPDGSPITDESGSVVGLCSRSADGRARVLDLTAVADLVRWFSGGWIGITGQLAHGTVTVTAVAAGSPAEQAGLRAGDVIVEVDGVPVADLGDFGDQVREREPGTDVVISVERDGDLVELIVTVGDRAQSVASSPPPADAPASTTSATVVTATSEAGSGSDGSAPPPSATTPPPTDPSPPTTAPASASG